MFAVTVVIPAFNEENSLGSTIDAIIQAFAKHGSGDFEILVVDDGSTDRTPAIAEEWCKRTSHIRTVRHATNQGLGEVYRTAIATARGALLAVFPADDQFEAEDLLAVVSAGETSDLVLGYMDDFKRPMFSRLLSFIEWTLVRTLIGPIPRVHGLFAFRNDKVAGLPLSTRGRGWQVITEIVARMALQGCSVSRVKTGLRPRTHGLSRAVSLKAIWSNASQLFQIWKSLRTNN